MTGRSLNGKLEEITGRIRACRFCAETPAGVTDLGRVRSRDAAEVDPAADVDLLAADEVE